MSCFQRLRACCAVRMALPRDSTAHSWKRARKRRWQKRSTIPISRIEGGVTEWCKCFDAALQRSAYRVCDALNEVQATFDIREPYWRGHVHVAQSQGAYLAVRALYKQAEDVYTAAVTEYDAALQLAPDDVAVHNKGIVLTRLGDLQAQLGHDGNGCDFYRAAAREYARVLEIAPGIRGIHEVQNAVKRKIEATCG